MGTYRSILNNVLGALRESKVDDVETTISDTYQQMIGDFLNQIKEEVEDAHNWRALQRSHTCTITASTSSGTIAATDPRSRLARAKADDSLVPLVFDVTNPALPIPLLELPLTEILYRIATDIPGTSTEPAYFAIQGSAGDGLLTLLVYPKPTTTRTITLQMYTPQARLTTAMLDTEVLVPRRPLEVGTLWFAFEERGEELGASSLYTEERYRLALDAAIARDDAEQGGNDLIVV